ncbi:MAG TPA: DUF2461 domain-containing protein [Streptosporangiaceae bacterium]|jgi:uncharacterized protein (TIGR02453 family)
MAFEGWPAEALEFYEGLAADNSKSYWLAHKHVYDECVLAPMRELLAELAAEHGDAKIFRPYRDVRFSKDKSPYKHEIAASFRDGYVRLSADGLGAGRGMHEMAPDQLDRYRGAVAADVTGEALAKTVGVLREQDIDVQGHESLKKVPRGYPADHPRGELLRQKGLYAWRQWPVEPWLGTPAARTQVAGFLAAAKPLSDWLAEHVGPSGLAAGS